MFPNYVFSLLFVSFITPLINKLAETFDNVIPVFYTWPIFYFT